MSRARDLADRVLHNRTHEDTEGGRESILTFKGEQSGGEISTLAQIQASHDGTSDDEKADLIFKTNDGSDGASPTERLRIDSAGSIIPATLGTNNTHLGDGAGESIASGGQRNTFVGSTSGQSTTTGDFNSALGNNSLNANVTGTHNTAIGDFSLALSTGNENTAVGQGSLEANTSGAKNTAVGKSALSSNTTTNGQTAFGYQALKLSTGANNAALGMDAGVANTTGAQNTFVGRDAAYSNTTGSNNTSLGNAALYSNTTASQNTSVGYQAGYSGTTGAENTYLGFQTGYSCVTGVANTMIGRNAGSAATSGFNTFLGTSAGATITSGEKNTIIGRYSGNDGSLDIRTSSNNIVLSDGDGNPRGYYTDAWWFKTPDAAVALRAYRQRNTTGGSIQIWSSDVSSSTSTKGYMLTEGAMYNSTGTYGTISDERLKQDIVDANSQWEDVKALKFRNYRMIDDVKADPDSTAMLGVIAQEVEEAGMDGLVGVNEEGYKHVKLSILYMKAVKALQEAMARIETLETENTAIKARLDALEAE